MGKITRKPSRKYLEQIFGNNHDLIKQYENLFEDSESIIKEINTIEESVGLDEDGNYIAPADSRFINSSTTVVEALNLLDEAIGSQKIINIDISTVLLPINQLIICDATISDIDIFLPDPSDSFANNESKTISITKKDISSNIVNINPNNSELVVGESSQSLVLYGELLTFVTDGTNWYLGG